jgi:hypothetical protein
MARNQGWSENAVRNNIMLDLGHGDVRLYRNNIGAYQDPHDPAGKRWITYGVGNPGGSDLIGYKSIVITPDMVGQRVAVFVAIETKAEFGGREEDDQKTFIANVKAAGGLAGFARSVDEGRSILDK